MLKHDRKRLPPVDATTRELYLYSGNRCAFEGCTEVLLKENGTWNCQVAHIYGVKPGSARGDHNLSNEKLREPSNLLLMCPNHHNEIDNQKLESTYTVEKVQRLKTDHEAKYKKALQGLARIVDDTAEVVAKYPKNLCALDGYCTNLTEDEIRENAELAEPFVKALVEQPIALRDVIALVLVHGKAENYWGTRRVFATTTRIEAAASSITPYDLCDRAKSLEHDGLLMIDHDESVSYFVLQDPTRDTVGWEDLFAAIHDRAAGAPEIIKRIVLDLDFTVMDV